MNVSLMAIEGLPEFGPGADIAALVTEGATRAGVPIQRGDIVVVTQKIVSKVEGQLVRLADVAPSPFSTAWGAAHHCDPRLIELVLRESRRIVRMDRGLLITETHHGLVCANSGVDVSNVEGGEVAAILPKDPDASARRIRDAIVARVGHDVAVVISDTFGRPWREGLVNVAIGAAGLAPLQSYVDARDPRGFALKSTVQALADEVAAASGLIARKLNRVPAVIVRGVSYDSANKAGGGAKDLIRPPERDLFR